MIYDLLFVDDEDLTFTDSMDCIPRGGTMTDAISLDDSIRCQVIQCSMTDTMTFVDNVSTIGNAFSKELDDTLDFVEDMAPKANVELMADTMVWVDVFEYPQYVLSDDLEFDDSLDFVVSTKLSSDLVTFSDGFSITIIPTLEIDEELTFVDAFGVYINDPWRPMVPIVEQT